MILVLVEYWSDGSLGADEFCTNRHITILIRIVGDVIPRIAV